MKTFELVSRVTSSLAGWCLLWSVPAGAASEEALRVAVTIPPQAWLVEQIGGAAVEPVVVIDAGESPATFQPTDSLITALARSALYFRIGVPAERGPWFRALQSMGHPRVVDLRDGLELRQIDQHHHHPEHQHHGHHSVAHDSSGLDPHVWLSPSRLITMATTIAAELTTIDPQRQAVYESGRSRLVAELEALDAELSSRFTPLAGASFFVFHPAWGYFADDYGLRQVAIEIEGKEPSESDLTRLTNQARELETRAIFVQPQIVGRSARSIADAVGAEILTLDPLAPDVIEGLRQVGVRLEAIVSTRTTNQ